MNRREAIKAGAVTAAGMLMGGSVMAQSTVQGTPLRVLIFGGTGFIGPHFVEVLRGAKS